MVLRRSERRKRTAHGGQEGGDEKVIGDSDISVAMEGVWREGRAGGYGRKVVNVGDEGVVVKCGNCGTWY